MKKVIIALLFFAIIFIGWKLYSKQNIHRPISLDNVESVVLWGDGIQEGHQGRMASQDEVTKIVEWFNSITNIQENRDFAGTTPNAGIRINLKSGKKVSIFNSGTDFEVQREDVVGRNISYWAKQKNIRELLEDLRE